MVVEHGRLIGILTSRDLLRAFAARVQPSEARIRDWMTAEPVAVPAYAPYVVAAVIALTATGLAALLRLIIGAMV